MIGAAYPWEQQDSQRPWEMAAAPVYVRTITVKRPQPAASSSPATGPLGYQGATEADEVVLVAGVVAEISFSTSSGRARSGGHDLLPDDSPAIAWRVSVPASAMPSMAMLLSGDVIYDDLGRRFQVEAYFPTILSGEIMARQLLA